MRAAGFRYRDEWLPNFFPSRQVGPNHFLRLTRTGAMQILTQRENQQLDEIRMDEALFQRLEQSGHILTSNNSQRVLEDLKTWHLKTYRGPGLHLVVLTKRCNLNCTYCHMNPEAISADAGRFDMTKETAREVIRFALATPSPYLTFEFQGGEPFLNFPVMAYFVEELKRQNASVGKKINLAVTSNLMVVKEEHLDFCRANDINVSYSLNGPPDIHDSYRVTRSGEGSYDVVMKRLKQFREKYPDVLSSSPLCVVDSENAKDLIRMIDWYHDQGFKGVSVIKLKHLGNTLKGKFRFDIDVFLEHYVKALDYLYEKNKRLDENYSERIVRVLLTKILSRTDTGYVDWANPSGDFGSAIVYEYDGEIVPSDEARSLRDEFGLGNVRDVTYEQLIHQEKPFIPMNLSLRDRDPTCRECAYNPYCGVLPVLDFARTGSAVPRPHESHECRQVIAILDWMFKKLEEDPLPLFRMLPGMDTTLAALAEQIQAV